jgi:hypothetical protein
VTNRTNLHILAPRAAQTGAGEEHDMVGTWFGRGVLAAALAGTFAVTAPAGATPTPALVSRTTVTGPAGGQVAVTLGADTRVEYGKPFATVTATAGRLQGVALTSASGWVQQASGRTTACAFAATCERWDYPDVTGSTRGDTIALPHGTYTVTLLGEPGSRVTAVLALPGVRSGRAALRTARTVAVRVADIASTPPATGDTQPYSWGAATPAGGTARPTLAGVVQQADVQYLHSAAFGVCIHKGSAASTPLICEDAEYSSASGVYVYECPVAVACLPFSADPFAFSVTSAWLFDGTPTMSADALLRAGKSRVHALAFAVTPG